MGLTAKFFWRRAFPSLMLVSCFVLLYESTVSDSRYAARQAEPGKRSERIVAKEVPAGAHREVLGGVSQGQVEDRHQRQADSLGRASPADEGENRGEHYWTCD